MVDNFKLLVSALMVVAGIAGFYLLSEMPVVVRVISVLLGLIAAVGVAWLTEPGKRFFVFSQEAITEARKVVWPTRKETMQMTGVVAVFVVVMALFLWLVDGSLTWVVKMLLDRGE